MVDKVHQLLDETISNSNGTRCGTKEQQYTPHLQIQNLKLA